MTYTVLKQRLCHSRDALLTRSPRSWLTCSRCWRRSGEGWRPSGACSSPGPAGSAGGIGPDAGISPSPAYLSNKEFTVYPRSSAGRWPNIKQTIPEILTSHGNGAGSVLIFLKKGNCRHCVLQIKEEQQLKILHLWWCADDICSIFQLDDAEPHHSFTERSACWTHLSAGQTFHQSKNMALHETKLLKK